MTGAQVATIQVQEPTWPVVLVVAIAILVVVLRGVEKRFPGTATRVQRGYVACAFLFVAVFAIMLADVSSGEDYAAIIEEELDYEDVFIFGEEEHTKHFTGKENGLTIEGTIIINGSKIGVFIDK